MQPIALFCHWHTGSTCLAKVFAAAGMEVGNDVTGFVDRNPGQEHPALSRICNNAYHHHIGRPNSFDELRNKAELKQVLQSYVRQAEEHGWKFFGIKNNFMADDFCWDTFGPIFEEVWEDMQIIMTLRHPIDICKSTSDDPSWTDDQVVQSWLGTVRTTRQIVTSGGELIMFPFNKTTLKTLLGKVGLKNTKTVVNVYNRDVIKNVSTLEEINNFNARYPQARDAFEELLEIAMG